MIVVILHYLFCYCPSHRHRCRPWCRYILRKQRFQSVTNYNTLSIVVIVAIRGGEVLLQLHELLIWMLLLVIGCEFVIQLFEALLVVDSKYVLLFLSYVVL